MGVIRNLQVGWSVVNKQVESKVESSRLSTEKQKGEKMKSCVERFMKENLGKAVKPWRN